ncbi:hypothetical protein [Acinetobacter bereziniae]|uniref:hypothetical protein n=1 Tax=Acinetobacter bereziniae TaxID=106648 RepID=UPI00125EBDB4|nr:hypothetical protein [Acinetobacter bereziniae]
MDKKIDLLGKLFISYSVILAVCFLFYSLVVLPITGAEKVNAIIGLLGWSATIFAPIAAYFLLDSWKDQEKFKRTIEFYEFGIESIHKSIANLNKLQDKYNVVLIGIEFAENSDQSFISKFKSRFNQHKKNQELEKFLTDRENLVFDSYLHTFELLNKYASDYLKVMDSDEKLQGIFDINHRINKLLFAMMQDINNCAHMLSCISVKKQAMEKLEKIISI